MIGNRWLRGQKPHESKSLDNVVYPRRAEKDSWHFFKILECCNHFLGQGGGGAGTGGGVDATSTRPMAVTLITANGQEESDLMQVPKSKGNNDIQKMKKNLIKLHAETFQSKLFSVLFLKFLDPKKINFIFIVLK